MERYCFQKSGQPVSNAGGIAGKKTYRLDGILDFHRFGGDSSDGNNLLMRRTAVSTVSIASVAHQDDGTEFWYQDLKSHCMNSLKIEPANA